MSDFPTSDSALRFFRAIKDWHATEASNVFATFAAWEWFQRQHRDELVESGQLIIRKGPGGSLAGPRLGEVVVEILRRESREQEAA